MRLRRVLVLNKWRRCAPPDKHTPMQLNSTHYTMLPLHRLRIAHSFLHKNNLLERRAEGILYFESKRYRYANTQSIPKQRSGNACISKRACSVTGAQGRTECAKAEKPPYSSPTLFPDT